MGPEWVLCNTPIALKQNMVRLVVFIIFTQYGVDCRVIDAHLYLYLLIFSCTYPFLNVVALQLHGSQWKGSILDVSFAMSIMHTNQQKVQHSVNYSAIPNAGGHVIDPSLSHITGPGSSAASVPTPCYSILYAGANPALLRYSNDQQQHFRARTPSYLKVDRGTFSMPQNPIATGHLHRQSHLLPRQQQHYAPGVYVQSQLPHESYHVGQGMMVMPVVVDNYPSSSGQSPYNMQQHWSAVPQQGPMPPVQLHRVSGHGQGYASSSMFNAGGLPTQYNSGHHLQAQPFPPVQTQPHCYDGRGIQGRDHEPVDDSGSRMNTGQSGQYKPMDKIFRGTRRRRRKSKKATEKDTRNSQSPPLMPSEDGNETSEMIDDRRVPGTHTPEDVEVCE